MSDIGDDIYQAYLDQNDLIQSLEQKLEAAQSETGWISVESDPIPEDQTCLVYVEDKNGARTRFHVCTNTKGLTVVGNMFHFDMPEITHWMPLPTAPAKEDG